MQNQTTIYGTFNARNLSPLQVAESFVKNDEFDELVALSHSILMGARGSGKTTMFKMMTLPALYNWNSETAKNLIDDLPFFAVYIPTDIHWHTQYSHYKKELELFPKFSKRLSETLICTNILSSFCSTIINVFKYRIKPNDGQEEELSKVLMRAWKIPPTIANLECINESLYFRINEINTRVRKVINSNKSDEDIDYTDLEFFDLDFFSCLNIACEAFQRIFPSDQKYKWALCFDELELAPEWFKEYLFASLRSVDQKFVFKLSSSPIISFSKDMLASPGNDVKLIRMWPHGQKSSKLFSDAFIRSVLKKNNITVDPAELFGKSPIFSSNTSNDDTKEYDEGTITYNKIKELAQKDPALRKLLEHHNIDPGHPIAKDVSQLNTVLRKIKQIVYFRTEIFAERGGEKVRRSRKVNPLYYGKEVIYNISDGNPRWLIGIINDLLKVIPRDGKKAITIKENDQAVILEKVSKRFFALISAPPEASRKYKGKMLFLHSIIESIGTYFHNDLAEGDFPLDVKASFTVDVNDKEIIELLEFALYQGAIVLINPSEDSFDFQVSGKRFRLSYLLAPKFKLLLRKGNSVNLSSCLKPTAQLATGQQEIIPFE